MKTIKTEEKQLIKSVKYVCEEEGCGWTGDDKPKAESHQATHAVKEKRDLKYGIRLRRFETESDFIVYSERVLYIRPDSHIWFGPGWYVEAWEDAEDGDPALIPAKNMIGKYRAEAERYGELIKTIKDNLGAELEREMDEG